MGEPILIPVTPRVLSFENLPTAILRLELSTAFVENDLFTLHEALITLEKLKGTTAPTVVKEHAIVILRGLESAGITIHRLCGNLVEIGFKLDELPEGAETILRRRFQLTDRSLVAADGMKERMMDRGEVIYCEAFEREQLVRMSKTSEAMVPLTEEDEEDEMGNH